MAVTGTTNRNDYTGDGTTVAFAYTFKIFANTDLQVFVAGVLKTLTTDYTVSGVGQAAGGNVTFIVAPAAAAKVAIVRSVPYTQTTTWVDNSPFPASNLNDAADKQTILSQQLLDTASRVPTFAASSTFKNPKLDDPVAAQILRWKADLSGVESVAMTNVSALPLPVAVASGGTGATAAAGAQTNLGVPPTTRLVAAGVGLTGGGDLSLDRTLALVTPVAVASGGTGATTAAGAQANLNVPPATRLITAGAGLNGGGDLSADRTLALILPVPVASGGTGATTTTAAMANLKGPYVTVTSYGAVGDGVADDTAAIQAAINAGGANSVVFFPKGTYKLTSALTISTNVSLFGAGRDASVLQTAINILMVSITTGASEFSNLNIQNLGFRYTGPAAGNTSVGINVSGTSTFSRSEISQCHFAGTNTGIMLQTTGLVQHLKISDNNFDNSGLVAHTYAIRSTSNFGIGTIVNNRIQVDNSGSGISLENAGIGDTIIAGNMIEGATTTRGINLDASSVPTYGQRFVVAGNKIDGTATPIRLVGISVSSFVGNQFTGGVAPFTFIGGAESGNEYSSRSSLLVLGRTGDTAAAGATSFLLPATINAAGGASVRVPYPFVVRNLVVQSNVPPGTSQTFVYTVRKSAAATALTATISGGNVTANSDATVIHGVANDTIDVQLVTSATAAVTGHVATVDVMALQPS